ncbi:MAG: O-antigen ligase family protein [Desulfuromusa sp.]|nr:O-antigen ligase family protein [Desulfuromusa sp.]
MGAKLGVYNFSSGRVYGNYGQPNLLATLMLLGLFSYSHVLSNTGRKKIIYLLPSLLISVVLFMTASRAGMVALCLSALLVIVLWKKEQLLRLRPHFVQLFIVVIIAWGISQFVGDWTPLSRAGAAWSEGTGTYKRLVFWLAAVLMGRDHWLTGVGFGGYARNLGDYAIQSTEFLHLPYNMIGETLWAHNDFLHIFAEHGIFVFLLVIVFVVLLLIGCWKQLSRANIFIFLGIVSFVCMMCFSHPLYFHNLALMACLALAPILGRWRGKKICIPRKFATPVIVVLIIVINFFVISHYFKMFELLQFRHYMVASDIPYTERYKTASALYLSGNIDDSIYGWQFKHTLYTNLVDRLQETDNRDLAKYVLPDMVSYSQQNRFPSYLFSLAKLYYILGDYEKAKKYASQAYDRNPDIDRYFDLLHLSNALLISRNNKIVIGKLIPSEKIEELKEQKVLLSRQFDSLGIAL